MPSTAADRRRASITQGIAAGGRGGDHPAAPTEQKNAEMSRAFVNEDGAAPEPRHRFPLPASDDPAFPEAAARALLQGANEGDSGTAEAATGYLFGDPR